MSRTNGYDSDDNSPTKNTRVRPTRSTRKCRRIRFPGGINSDEGDDSDSDFEVQTPTKCELNTAKREETSPSALCKLLSSTKINSKLHHRCFEFCN